MAVGWLWSGFSDCQKPSFSSGVSWTVKRRLFQWVSSTGGEEGGDLFGAVVGEEPLFDEGVDVVELRDFDEEGGHGGGAAGDEFEVADGSEEGGATALGILPALALLEAEGGKEAGEAVKFSAWRAGRGDGADDRDSLNHRFDCIVWEYGGDCCCCLLDCDCRGEMPVNYETLLCEVKDQVAQSDAEPAGGAECAERQGVQRAGTGVHDAGGGCGRAGDSADGRGREGVCGGGGHQRDCCGWMLRRARRRRGAGRRSFG